MNWQLFLSVWLFVQMVVGTVRSVRYARLRNEKENIVIASAVGSVIKIMGMYACLYFGGFYSP